MSQTQKKLFVNAGTQTEAISLVSIETQTQMKPVISVETQTQKFSAEVQTQTQKSSAVSVDTQTLAKSEVAVETQTEKSSTEIQTQTERPSSVQVETQTSKPAAIQTQAAPIFLECSQLPDEKLLRKSSATHVPSRNNLFKNAIQKVKDQAENDNFGFQKPARNTQRYAAFGKELGQPKSDEKVPSRYAAGKCHQKSFEKVRRVDNRSVPSDTDQRKPKYRDYRGRQAERQGNRNDQQRSFGHNKPPPDQQHQGQFKKAQNQRDGYQTKKNMKNYHQKKEQGSRRNI